jgi:hypothetical protein
MTSRGVVMNEREELYDSLVRLALMLIFTISLTAGTIGLISICQMLMSNRLTRPEITNYTLADAQ